MYRVLIPTVFVFGVFSQAQAQFGAAALGAQREDLKVECFQKKNAAACYDLQRLDQEERDRQEQAHRQLQPPSPYDPLQLDRMEGTLNDLNRRR